MPIVKLIRRPCDRCHELFPKKTRHSRICDKCNKNINKTYVKPKKYNTILTILDIRKINPGRPLKYQNIISLTSDGVSQYNRKI